MLQVVMRLASSWSLSSARLNRMGTFRRASSFHTSSMGPKSLLKAARFSTKQATEVSAVALTVLRAKFQAFLSSLAFACIVIE